MSTGPPKTASPTAFPDLNDLLRDLVLRVRSILGPSFVGAYLTGSFALGAADLHSDCDFLIVTSNEVNSDQEKALRGLHDEIPTRSGYWPHNVEGSYAPDADLITLAALGKPWLYIDRGWRQMQWSPHCNTEDVRWTLREHGIRLAGPDPGELVAEVPADALRRRSRETIQSFLPDLFAWTNFDIAWSQRYAVTTLCRMMHTLETGRVASKRDSLEWAKDALHSAWRHLIEQALDDREIGWDPNDAPRPGTVKATIAFAEYAKRRSLESPGWP